MKASEYRQHAQECRALAATMESEEQRELLVQMAKQWDKLAADRVELLEKHPDVAQDREHEENRAWRPTG